MRNVFLSTVDRHASDIDRVSPAWRDAASDICKFSKLRSVRIRFRQHCRDDDDIDARFEIEDEKFRKNVLKIVLGALNQETSRTDNLRSLTIINLQNKNNDDITNSSDLKNVFARITELHLLIAVQMDEDCPHKYVIKDALYDFYSAGLSNAWLKPASQNLTHLTLYAVTYWGWVPGFDPRGLRFPNVKYLALGSYTFAHDWQIEWIISHFADLQTLIMVDCPIVFHMHRADHLGHDVDDVSHEDHIKLRSYYFLPNQYVLKEPHDDSHWIYNSRWHQFFPKFETRMLSLTKFVYAHEGWPNVYDTEQAFNERDRLVSSFKLKRYIAFHGFRLPCHWEEEYKGDETFENIRVAMRAMTPATVEPPYHIILGNEGAPSQPGEVGSVDGQHNNGDFTGCQKKDEEALNSLLRTVARRAREKGV